MEPFIIFLIIFFLCIITVRCQDSCSLSRCGNENSNPVIHFPFRLNDRQQERCGYPGFDLSCDGSKRTVLDLGSSGKFLVRDIDYVRQVIQIDDEDNCLPKRLVTLNLSDSVFTAYDPQNIIFFNCSSNISVEVGIPFLPIRCLSSSNYTVYVSYPFAKSRLIFNSCETVETVIRTGIPALNYGGYETEYLTNYNYDISLRWNCEGCAERGGDCGFKKTSGDKIGCFDKPRRGMSKTVKYFLGAGLGIPGVAGLLLIGSCVFARYKSFGVANNLRHIEASSTILPQPHVFVVGLDESVIQSYPKTVLGESRRLANPEDNICSICLSEYKSKETLKSIPDCEHFFHAACIDEWLHRNVTCPLCRNYPKPVSELSKAGAASDVIM